MMKLSQYFPASAVIRDGEFTVLGHVDSVYSGTLAYCDTVYYLEKANENDNITVVLTRKNLSQEVSPSKGIVAVDQPRNDFYRVHHRLIDEGFVNTGIHHKIGKDCSIHPSAIVSEYVTIGNHVTIGEGVIIKDHVVIGDNTFIDAGVVIGNEGLLYTQQDGEIYRVRHSGGVRIGQNVTILSNAVIVRSIHPTLLTVIGDNSIIGIRSTVGHEVQLGRNCVILGDCVLARKAVVEDFVWVGSSSVIREYVRIGRKARVMAGSVVIKDVPEEEEVSGNFALRHKKNIANFLRAQK